MKLVPMTPDVRRERNATRARRRYRRMVDAGLCFRCGVAVEPHRRGQSRCDSCTNDARDEARRRLSNPAPRVYHCSGCGETGHSLTRCPRARDGVEA